MKGWYGNVYDKAPTLSTSIQIARTKNMRLYYGKHRGTSNPVSCDIAPLRQCESFLNVYAGPYEDFLHQSYAKTKYNVLKFLT